MTMLMLMVVDLLSVEDQMCECRQGPLNKRFYPS